MDSRLAIHHLEGMSMDIHDVQNAVRGAVSELIEEDRDLLELTVGERTIVARLAARLIPRFDGWDVDAEYNRHGQHPKVLYIFRHLLREAGLPAPERDYPRSPDIVIHRRGNDDANLLAIEVKRLSNGTDRLYDKRKLHALREELPYRFTLYLELGDGGSTGSIIAEEWCVR